MQAIASISVEVVFILLAAPLQRNKPPVLRFQMKVQRIGFHDIVLYVSGQVRAVKPKLRLRLRSVCLVFIYL